MYALKQSPRAWCSKLSGKLQELSFVPSKADTSLFVFNGGGVVIYMLIYVGDIIIASSCITAIEKLIQKLHTTFAVKDLGNLSYFLRVEVTANTQ